MSNFNVDDLIWVELNKDDNFLIIKETLTRMGIASKNEKRLTQTCHILHKRGKYAIVHFKELFLLDGKPADFTDEDKARRNAIVQLLEDWDLVKIVKPLDDDTIAPLSQIKIIPSKEKAEWSLVSKYTIGGNKRKT